MWVAGWWQLRVPPRSSARRHHDITARYKPKDMAALFAAPLCVPRLAPTSLSSRAALTPLLPGCRRVRSVSEGASALLGVVAEAAPRAGVRRAGKEVALQDKRRQKIANVEQQLVSTNAEKSGTWTIGEVHHKLRLDRALKVQAQRKLALWWLFREESGSL